MARPGTQGGQYQPLAQEQIHGIHMASLRLLEQVGIHMGNEGALALYHQGRARIGGQRVHIPPAMVEAWAACPFKLILAA